RAASSRWITTSRRVSIASDRASAADRSALALALHLRDALVDFTRDLRLALLALAAARGLPRCCTGLARLGRLRLRSPTGRARLACDVAVLVEEVDVAAVVHLDPGRRDLLGLPLGLARLLARHRPDVAVLDVVHLVVVALDPETRDLVTHGQV